MFYLFLMVVLVLLGAMSWYTHKEYAKKTKAEKEENVILLYFEKVWIGVIVLIILLTMLFSLHQIPAGYIGVVYEFGSIRTQITEGLKFEVPWREIVLANVQIQKAQFEKLDCGSAESQSVFINVSVNFSVSANAIQNLFRNVGKNYKDVLITSRVQDYLKNETVKYKAVDILPNREKIRKAVKDKLQADLEKYSITVHDVLFDNIAFSETFEASIEAKQAATQEALKEQEKIKIVQAQAQQAIELAKGKGQAILEEALKQAEANKAIAESLTPELVQYALTQKLGDKVQVIFVPQGQGYILDLGNITSKP